MAISGAIASSQLTPPAMLMNKVSMLWNLSVFQGWFQGTPIMGPPIMVSLYYSHIFWDVWDTIPLIFWGWKRRRNASRNLQKVELKCHVKCMCTLKGTITYYDLGKGKSSTQKCRLGWNMLVPRRVCTWSFHVISEILWCMCEIKLHTWTHLFTKRCVHLWRLIFYFAQTGIGSKYLIHVHPRAKSNVEEGNFFDHMWTSWGPSDLRLSIWRVSIYKCSKYILIYCAYIIYKYIYG